MAAGGTTARARVIEGDRTGHHQGKTSRGNLTPDSGRAIHTHHAGEIWHIHMHQLLYAGELTGTLTPSEPHPLILGGVVAGIVGYFFQ